MPAASRTEGTTSTDSNGEPAPEPDASSVLPAHGRNRQLSDRDARTPHKRKSAASFSTAWAAAPGPGTAPGGKPGSSPPRSTTRWSASSSSGSSTPCRPCTPTQPCGATSPSISPKPAIASPGGCRLALELAPPGSSREGWLAAAARFSAGVMARKFIAGATPAEAIQTVVGLRRRRLAFTADLLGEAVISELEADLYQQTCLTLLRDLDGPIGIRARDPADRPRPPRPDPPRESLAQALQPDRPLRADPRRAIDRVRRSAAAADPAPRSREQGAQIHVDMEQYTYRALSYELFCQVLEEPEFRDWPDVGIVVQAYHADAEAELQMLRDWVERRGSPITIRLVKGAYWDYEVATARRLGLARAGLPPEMAERRLL